MPLEIVRNDITKMKVDAIVNAANRSLLGGGGVDGCIHRAAGLALLEECRGLGGCETGGAKVTGAYNLPCKYVIHAVGPVWSGGAHGEREKLASCYRTSLELAKERGCETVAFPLISSGAYRYPKDQALQVAVETISTFLLENDMTVYIVVFDRESYQIGEKLYDDIAEYIDDRYAGEHADSVEERLRRCNRLETLPRGTKEYFYRTAEELDNTCAAPEKSLDDAVGELGESFSEALLRMIDERGMTDAQCYKRANIDRKHFSKIRSDKDYQPSKRTALAFAVALRLNLRETDELLRKAGFALTHSSKTDIIVEYFITRGNYDIFDINTSLFAFGQNTLGA